MNNDEFIHHLGKIMGKGPIYGEFTFPKSSTTFVRGYSRGGKVAQAKVSKVMHEFGAGELHSGSKKGPVVKDRKQAIAIGMSEGRKAAAGKYASGGMVETSKIPMPRDSLTKVDIRPKPPIIDRTKTINKAKGGPVPGGGVGGSGKLLGELMGIPKKNEIGKDSRKYAAGGMVNKPAPVMKPRGKKPPSGKSLKNPVPKDAAMPKAPGSPSAKAGPPAMSMTKGMKAGGLAKKASMKMSPKAHSDAPPKSVNVKSRMGIGLGSMENLKHGGHVKAVKKYAAGGMTHPDAAQDKALIKRAVGMHDTQLHGGKHTNLTKLRSGGMAKVEKYSKGGKVKNCYSHGGSVHAERGLHGAGMGGGLGQMAGKKAPTGGKAMKTGGVVSKRRGGMCK